MESMGHIVRNSKLKNPQTESKLRLQLRQARSRINDLKTALTVHKKGTDEFQKAEQKIDNAREEYIRVLNKLNRLRSQNRNKTISENSKPLKKIEFYKKEGDQQFTYIDDPSNRYIADANIRYKGGIMDMVIF